jgi:hypothetical protein
MKTCIQFLRSLFQSAPCDLVHTSPRHVNVPEISRPSGSSIPSAAETASDLTPSGCVNQLALVNKPTVSGLVRNLDTSYFQFSLEMCLLCILYECKRAEGCFTIDYTYFQIALYAVLNI